MQNIVFFGSGDFTIPVVQKLLPHRLDLVVTNDKDSNSPLLEFCDSNNIQTLIASSPKDLTNHYSLFSNHSVAVLASYGVFIPDEIINAFPNGIINIHPSLLPKYKGPSPVQYALLNGETTTGVTLIKLDSEIDHGPILSQKPYTLQGNETSQDLLSILFEIGADMVEKEITKLKKGEQLTETAQDHSQETWSYKIEKKDGMINLSKIPTSELEIINLKSEIDHKVRAFYPWPGVWLATNLKNQTKIIKLLPESRIQVEGKKSMSYKDFVNGFGIEGEVLLKKMGIK